MGEESFLRAILESPKDDAQLAVYADWLEEQDDTTSTAKAEFLRLTVEQSAPTESKSKRDARQKRLQQLAATLDTGWLTVVSHLSIESCQGQRAKAKSQPSYPLTFEYLCDRRWEDLQATDDRGVRYCDSCKHSVHYCDTIVEARKHAWAGHCIAVDLGVMRREGDLRPEVQFLGMPSMDTLREEEDRVKPDPVSVERERRKRMVKKK